MPKQNMKALLHDRFLVGEVYYEPPRRRKPFTAGLQHRFYKDSSLEAHRHAEHRRKHAVVIAEAKAANVTRKMLREMKQIRHLQDKLTRQQGHHLQAGETLFAATLIQSVWRGRRARRRVRDAQMLRALRVIRKVILRHVEKKRRSAATARGVGLSVRERLAKLEAVPFLRCRVAATSIQSLWRLAVRRLQLRRRRIVRDVSNQLVEAAIAFATAHSIRQRVLPSVAASCIQRSWRRTLHRIHAMESRCEWQRVKATSSTLDKDCDSAPLNRKRHAHDKRVRGLRNENSATSPLTACTIGKKSSSIANAQRGPAESSTMARCATIQPSKVANVGSRTYRQAPRPGRKPLRSAKINEADNFQANEARNISPRRRQMPVLSRGLKADRDELTKDLQRSTKNIRDKIYEKNAGDRPCRVVADFPAHLDKVDLKRLAEDAVTQLSCSGANAESRQVQGSIISSPNPPDVGPSTRSLGLQSFRLSIGLAGNSPIQDVPAVRDDHHSINEISPAPHQAASHLSAMQPRETVEADETSQQLSSTLAQLAQVSGADDESLVEAPSAMDLSTPDLSVPKAAESPMQAEVSHDYTDDYEEDYEDDFSSEEG